MELGFISRRIGLGDYEAFKNYSNIDSLINEESGNNPHGTPDSSATFPNEIYYVDRKTTENRNIIQFELSASFDLNGVRLPKRQVLPNDFPGIGTFFS